MFALRRNSPSTPCSRTWPDQVPVRQSAGARSPSPNRSCSFRARRNRSGRTSRGTDVPGQQCRTVEARVEHEGAQPRTRHAGRRHQRRFKPFTARAARQLGTAGRCRRNSHACLSCGVTADRGDRRHSWNTVACQAACSCEGSRVPFSVRKESWWQAKGRRSGEDHDVLGVSCTLC